MDDRDIIFLSLWLKWGNPPSAAMWHLDDSSQGANRWYKMIGMEYSTSRWIWKRFTNLDFCWNERGLGFLFTKSSCGPKSLVLFGREDHFEPEPNLKNYHSAYSTSIQLIHPQITVKFWKKHNPHQRKLPTTLGQKVLKLKLRKGSKKKGRCFPVPEGAECHRNLRAQKPLSGNKAVIRPS